MLSQGEEKRWHPTTETHGVTTHNAPTCSNENPVTRHLITVFLL